MARIGEHTMKVLSGHTSQETAYLVEDYPYGFTLRCKIRYWLEYKDGHGYRFMSQTTNPKKAVEVWNKPKASTYMPVAAAMFLDENGHTQWDALHFYAEADKIAEFRRLYAEAITPEMDAHIAKLMAYNQRVAERRAAEQTGRDEATKRARAILPPYGAVG